MWVSTFGMASRKSDEAAAIDFMEMKLVPEKGNTPTSRQGCSRIEKTVARLVEGWRLLRIAMSGRRPNTI